MTKKNDEDDLAGFRDFIQHDKENKSTLKKSNRYNDFELITFLEQESRRLSKQLNTFEEKVYIIKNYPQDVKLISEQEVDLAGTKAEVHTLLERKNSPLYKNLALIYNNFFNS